MTTQHYMWFTCKHEQYVHVPDEVAGTILLVCPAGQKGVWVIMATAFIGCMCQQARA